MESGRMAKGLKKERQKTVSILEAKSFSEAEALAKLGFEFVGMDEAQGAFVFKEKDPKK